MHIYIQCFCTRLHICAHVRALPYWRSLYENSWLRKEAYPISDLSFRLLFFSASHSRATIQRISVSFLSSNTLRFEAATRCRRTTCMQQLQGELIGLYHVKQFGSLKLLHGCLVWNRVDSWWKSSECGCYQ